MMSQIEQRAQKLQRQVQELCDGQFELMATSWGEDSELAEIAQGKTRIQKLGLILLENRQGDLEFIDSGTEISEALNQSPDARTLMIAGPARYLGIDSDGAGLKLFNLNGFTNA